MARVHKDPGTPVTYPPLSSRMHVVPGSLPDVLIVSPRLHTDGRGFFMETFRENDLASAGIRGPFVQDNHSGSRGGTLRGLHYQLPPRAQGKLVRVVAGEIFDVAVDLRRGSPTFGRWVGERLSAENRLQIWIPPGFAHGFLVVSDWAEVVYKTTDYYDLAAERTLRWNDPAVGVRWPLDGDEPSLSPKDAAAPGLDAVEAFD